MPVLPVPSLDLVPATPRLENPRSFVSRDSDAGREYHRHFTELANQNNGWHWLAVLRATASVVGTVHQVGGTPATTAAFRADWTVITDTYEGCPIDPPVVDALFLNWFPERVASVVEHVLEKCESKVSKYILISGTERWGQVGENGKDGILAGVAKFLREYVTEWEIEAHTPAADGLTVLKRTWNPRTDPPRGLGDDVANLLRDTALAKLAKSAARWLGVSCGCGQRQQWLNNWFGKYDAESR